jgi:hypothetical protein
MKTVVKWSVPDSVLFQTHLLPHAWDSVQHNGGQHAAQAGPDCLCLLQAAGAQPPHHQRRNLP